MKMFSQDETDARFTMWILVAGVCGGLAELVWVQLYTNVMGQDGTEIAHQVTASLLPNAAHTAYAPDLGLVIHFMFALLLAPVYVELVWRPFVRGRGPSTAIAVASLALATLWAINFLIVLPIVNPHFVDLLPYAVSLGSKLLFGLAMAGVLYAAPDLGSRVERIAR